MATLNQTLPIDHASKFNDYPYWAPRIWHGMSLGKWLRLLRDNRFDVNRYHLSAWVTMFCSLNSFTNRLQSALFGRRAGRTELVGPPLFIIGHWRTGTTYLHNLMSLDDRFWSPSTYECFSPAHFLVTSFAGPRFLNFPTRRPMDNMSMGWTQPQEDELALCVRGAPSVYRNIAFPANKSTDLDSLSPDDMTPADLKRWTKTFRDFVGYLNFARRKPLILKSPTHTGRVRLLLDMYPNAKFVHITRDPASFIPSTIHLWRALHYTNALRFKPELDDRVNYEDYVFQCFRKMYGSFEDNKRVIPQQNICQVTYDQLTNTPLETLQRVYDHLALPSYADVATRFREFAAQQGGYQRNQHQLSEGLRSRIELECADYKRQYCDEQPVRRSA